MDRDDLPYFQGRADAEVEQAQKAVSPEVVAVHYELATAYLARVEALQRRKEVAHV